MKILVFSSDFSPNPGGIAVFIHNLCLYLYKRKHQVLVLTVSKEECRKDEDKFDKNQPYDIHRYSCNRFASSISPILHTCYHVKSFAPDVLFLGHVVSTHGLGVVATKKIFRIPYVVLSHGADLEYAKVNKIDYWAVNKVLTNAELIMANSRYTQQVIGKQGYNRKKVHVLNPGVDTELFNPKQDTNFVINKYNLRNKRVILSIGRLVPKKNHRIVIAALSQVLKKIPNLCYLIIGSGNEETVLRKYVGELGLDSNVIFTGDVPHENLPSFYCSSDVFIMPSKIVADDFESFGIVFIEASACGKPVIGGRSGGIGDAVIDGETGLCVDPNDANEVAGAILRLFQDKQLAHQMGQKGRNRAVNEFDWSKIVIRLERMLSKINNCHQNSVN